MINSCDRELARNNEGELPSDCRQIAIADGTQIIVPDSLNSISTYVLLEQQDWFEDEIGFIRHYLQSGKQAIDIGANYGVYALSIAQKIGSEGHLWAFEPASNTASFLRASIATNQFSQITLVQSAVSKNSGAARLELDKNSELNSLVSDREVVERAETVTLCTLDECMDLYNWQNIDLIKLDAEGEETNIILGGSRFFQELSPLVMYEVKAAKSLRLDLVDRFQEIGYDSYRLVPELNILVPFESNVPADPYLLNLFCCKPDRAKQLADAGYLIPSITDLPPLTESSIATYSWSATLAELPYVRHLVDNWQTTNDGKLETAIAYYMASCDKSLAASNRFLALKNSFSLLQSVDRSQVSIPWKMTLARVASDYGERNMAVDILGDLLGIFDRGSEVDLTMPFLMPTARFDQLEPNSTISLFLFAAILEAFEESVHYSSYYSRRSSPLRLDKIQKIGYTSPAMDLRYSLVRQLHALSN
jgi:FkbM family methyltransferase